LNRTTGHDEPTVLLTGFAPFDDEQVNPSWEVVRALDDATIQGHRIVAARLPTEFEASLPALEHALHQSRPSIVVAVGLAGGRAGISLERVAINVIDARTPDNAGKQPIDVAVAQGGPAAYFTTLPIKATQAALQQAGIASHISQTAGTYVCNQVFYALMHACRPRTGIRAGFVHVPWLPDQAARHHAPGMPAMQMQLALTIIVQTALATRRDAQVPGGAIA
jgi:pyroglutamyl-peptidase